MGDKADSPPLTCQKYAFFPKRGNSFSFEMSLLIFIAGLPGLLEFGSSDPIMPVNVI